MRKLIKYLLLLTCCLSIPAIGANPYQFKLAINPTWQGCSYLIGYEVTNAQKQHIPLFLTSQSIQKAQTEQVITLDRKTSNVDPNHVVLVVLPIDGNNQFFTTPPINITSRNKTITFPDDFTNVTFVNLCVPPEMIDQKICL